MTQKSPAPGSSAVAIAGFYALYFAAVGVLQPFLPAYLKTLQFSGTEIGALLALTPTMGMVAPHVWGNLADRSGRPDRVLTAIALGALVFFAPMIAAQRYPLVFATLLAYAFFASSVTPIIDTIALRRVERAGGSYAHLRLFGSAGFVVASMGLGLWMARFDRTVVFVGVALIGGYLLATVALREKAAPPADRPNPLAGVRLLKDRDLAFFLAGSCLHWIACAPFHGLFGVHVQALGLEPWVVGISAGIGVIAEIAVMAVYPKVAKAIAPRELMLAALLASVVRWAGMAAVSNPYAIIALQVLHGMSFGAFYVAAIAFVSGRVPERLRASGQGLFASISFGVGGLLGYVGAGIGYDALKGHKLFAVAAGVELLAALLVVQVGRIRSVPR